MKKLADLLFNIRLELTVRKIKRIERRLGVHEFL